MAVLIVNLFKLLNYSSFYTKVLSNKAQCNYVNLHTKVLSSKAQCNFVIMHAKVLRTKRNVIFDEEISI